MSGGPPPDAISWSDGTQLLCVHALDTLKADSRLWSRVAGPWSATRMVDPARSSVSAPTSLTGSGLKRNCSRRAAWRPDSRD